MNLVNITILREAHLLDVNDWDKTTQLTDRIDGNNQWRHWNLPLMPCHEQKHYPHDNSIKEQYQDDMSNKCGTEWQGGWCICLVVQNEELRSKVWEWRTWVNWISVHRTVEKVSIGHSFIQFLLFSSLLLSVVHYFFGSRLSISDIHTGYTTSH